MGSLRNPVGPLPSSIYWRRRAVLFCLLAVVTALVAWALTSGGGGGKGSGAPTGSHTPIATITAGPAPSGTHISGRPGGRDTAPPAGSSGGSGTDGGSSAGTSGSSGSPGSAGTDGGTGTASDAGTSGGGSSSGGTGGSGGTSGAAAPLPADSSIPTCDPSRIQLTLTSVSNSYSPGETPAFQLRAANSGDQTCKIDFGPRSAVFTVVTATSDNHHVWASDDCPATGSDELQVPAHSSTTFTERWNEKTSSPKCASPKGAQASPGTYLVQAQLPGHQPKQVSFVLSAD